MMKFVDWKIFYKILISFVLFIVVVGGGVWFVILCMKQIDQVYFDIIDIDVQGLKVGLCVNQCVFNFGWLSWCLIVEIEMDVMKKVSEEIVVNQKEFVVNIEVVWKLLLSVVFKFDEVVEMFVDIYKKDYFLVEKVMMVDNNIEVLKLVCVMVVRMVELCQKMVKIMEDVE